MNNRKSELEDSESDPAYALMEEESAKLKYLLHQVCKEDREDATIWTQPISWRIRIAETGLGNSGVFEAEVGFHGSSGIHNITVG